MTLIRIGAAFATRVIRPLTDTQRQVQDAEPNVQPEEEDDVGHFAEQEQVAYVLLQCDCEREGGTMKAGEDDTSTRSEEGWITL